MQKIGISYLTKRERAMVFSASQVDMEQISVTVEATKLVDSYKNTINTIKKYIDKIRENNYHERSEDYSYSSGTLYVSSSSNHYPLEINKEYANIELLSTYKKAINQDTSSYSSIHQFYQNEIYHIAGQAKIECFSWAKIHFDTIIKQCIPTISSNASSTEIQVLNTKTGVNCGHLAKKFDNRAKFCDFIFTMKTNNDNIINTMFTPNYEELTILALGEIANN